ncbi:hypothetical protein NL64_06330 [Pseudomonas fluorescens]|uniref:hypothetical protein n=1 Tax=Pseudomonas fluorescens TaxID=294 RepID=UPI00054B1740|nr:hypothetical protein [Pseudomonas fluorescens]KII34875.1 hypothetical protein NL64_06330 [Pseudomonas fluorescens]
MHQVTETTIQDLIDRGVAFAHTAYEVARKFTKFNYIDLDTPIGDDHQRNRVDPLYPVAITLYNRTAGGTIMSLVDKDGNPAKASTHVEAPYNYSTYSDYLILRVPLFMLTFAGGVRDLMSLIEDPANGNQTCSYTRAAINELPGMPETMRDFSDCSWFQSTAQSATAGDHLIPELRITPGAFHCFAHAHPYPEYFRADRPLWQVREEARIRYSAYDQLPAPVLDALDPEKIQHLYPHLPTKPGNAGLIAYTQNATAGVMDRQAVMRAGRFIRQFAKEGTSDEAVKQLTAHAASHLGSQYKHSCEREDYKRVYISGPSSCMSYDETGKSFGKLMVNGEFVHPTEVYAHPENDLELVWMEVNENIVARTIVNKERMQYPRIYAKESVANALNRLQNYLEDLGYAQHDSALVDQKLLKISPDRYPHAILCPYIDSGNLGVYVRDDHLLTGGCENADHESGCLIDYNTSRSSDWCCECCDTDYDDDDGYEINDCGDRICQSCADNDHTRAYCTNQQEERYVHEDETVYELVSVNRGTLRYYSHIFFNSDFRDMGHYGLVELDTSYYDSNCVALIDDCTRTEDGNWLLTNDLADHDLFFNHETDEACQINDYAVCVDADGNDELVEVSDIDEELFECAPTELDSTYPMLRVYTAIIQGEEAA